MTKEQYILIEFLAQEYYNAETLAHAKRVRQYVKADNKYIFYTEEERTELKALALAHDLIEDTSVTIDYLSKLNLPTSFLLALEVLTHDKSVPYYTYIKSIVDYGGMALIVKCADMRDHLTLTDTLTDKLKAKYEKVLPLLKK